MLAFNKLKRAYDKEKKDFFNSLPNDEVLKELMEFNISLFDSQLAQQTGQQTSMTEKVEALTQDISTLKGEVQTLTQESTDKDAASETLKQEYLEVINRIVQERK